MNKMCEKIKEINMEGNVVPISWCDHVKKGEKQQTDLLAISILADIVYWYRPSLIRSEDSGKIIGYKQKFKYDKLQKTYESYANLFGFPKRAVKAAIDNLIELKLITREFRTLELSNDLKLSNVMYVEPIVENIVKITYKPKDKKCTTSLQNLVIPPYKKVQYLPTEFGGTNTKSNTENTTNIKRVSEKIFSIQTKKKNSIQKNLEKNLEKNSIQTAGYENLFAGIFSDSDFLPAAKPSLNKQKLYEVSKNLFHYMQVHNNVQYTPSQLSEGLSVLKTLLMENKVPIDRISTFVDWYSVAEHATHDYTTKIRTPGALTLDRFLSLEDSILRFERNKNKEEIEKKKEKTKRKSKKYSGKPIIPASSG